MIRFAKAHDFSIGSVNRAIKEVRLIREGKLLKKTVREMLKEIKEEMYPERVE